MFDLQRELIDTLSATPETLAGLLRGVSPAQARSAVGGDESWSVVEVLCHLRDAEEINLGRVRAMLDENNPEIAGFDQLALAREHNYREAEPLTALADFTRLRAEYIAVLAALAPPDWERPARHKEFGTITIVAQALHRTSHDAIHCAQIARQLLATDRRQPPTANR